MKKLLLLLASLGGAAPAAAQAGPPAPLPNTVIMPASDFLDELPKGDIIADAGAQRAPWLFNNTAVVLKSKTNLITQVVVPAAGTYTLYVRSQGAPKSSFRVVVSDHVTAASFGQGALSWQPGGTFELPPGPADVKITRIEGQQAAFDAVVLSQNPQLQAADIQPHQLNPDVRLLHEYAIPNSNAVKFGDLTGDGKTDFVVLTPDFSAHAYDNSGRALWHYQAPAEYVAERSEFEAPGVVWDFDHDGRAELAHWRYHDGREWLVLADGRTGRPVREVPWPTQPLPHVYNNFRLAVGRLRPGGPPNDLVAFTDMGGTINVSAYDARLRPLWTHPEHRAKDNLGHYVYPIDLDQNGVDEVLVGTLLLDAKGREIWNRFDLLPDNHDHADSYKFADVNHDGHLDIVTANSETGVFVREAFTGKTIWQNTAEHSQQIQVGDFLRQVPGPQVVVGGRTYGNRAAGEPYLASQLYWFDNQGHRVKKWPGTPLNGNPDFVRGNWRGDGRTTDLFWYKFRLNDQGTGELYFPDPVFHMFDFEGTGAEQVITLSPGWLRIYGSRQAPSTGQDLKKNLEYLQRTVANHTHY